MPNQGRPKGSRNKATDLKFIEDQAFRARKGTLKAEKQHDRDHAKLDFKNLWASAKEHLGKMLDRVDPLELGAVVGATIIIKTGIDWAAPNVQQFMTNIVNPAGTAFQIAWLVTLHPGDWGKFFAPENRNPPEPAPVPSAESQIPTEALQWITAFALAYLVVHNFGLIMQATGNITGGLLGMAKLLMV